MPLPNPRDPPQQLGTASRDQETADSRIPEKLSGSVARLTENLIRDRGMISRPFFFCFQHLGIFYHTIVRNFSEFHCDSIKSVLSADSILLNSTNAHRSYRVSLNLDLEFGEA